MWQPAGEPASKNAGGLTVVWECPCSPMDGFARCKFSKVKIASQALQVHPGKN